MEHAVDDDPLRFDFINQPVWPDDQLAEAWVGSVGIGAPALAEVGERVSGVADTLGKRRCEGG
jgi:hypothetical protein